jgi:hypothetical protein
VLIVLLIVSNGKLTITDLKKNESLLTTQPTTFRIIETYQWTVISQLMIVQLIQPMLVQTYK